MDRPYLVDKPIGATPLQALQLYRDARGFGASIKMSYAGRLDPLASGLLPILYGHMLSRQEEYWYLSKEYDTTVVLGVRSDSHDLLGLPERVRGVMPTSERITSIVRGLVGKIDLSVPIYSSHRVDGKPLFAWARTLPEGPAVVPVRRMSIHQIDVAHIEDIDLSSLQSVALHRVMRVDGDFRQDETVRAWEMCGNGADTLVSVGLHIQCGSGTYIRSLANEMGRRLGVGAIVSDLRRVRVGPWRVDDADVIRPSWKQ